MKATEKGRGGGGRWGIHCTLFLVAEGVSIKYRSTKKCTCKVVGDVLGEERVTPPLDEALPEDDVGGCQIAHGQGSHGPIKEVQLRYVLRRQLAVGPEHLSLKMGSLDCHWPGLPHTPDVRQSLGGNQGSGLTV